MRPTLISNANANPSAGVGGVGSGHNNTNTNTNGINIPIHHEYGSGGGYGSPRPQQPQQQQPQSQQAYNTQQQAPQGSQQQPQQQQQHPQHFQQGFGFEPDMDMDMDMDMFPRSRLGRMHDPFGNFNNSHFNFPQFNSLGRRRAADHMGRDDDFFNRLPSEFRQYIPEGFGHRRGENAATMPRQHGTQPQQQQQVPVQGSGPAYYQPYVPTTPANGMPQSPSKKLCDAAIQTEDPTIHAGGDQVDSAAPQQQQQHHGVDNLKQHGLRNTVDMGVKSAVESEQGMRAHSAPPQDQQQQQQPPQGSVNGKRQTPPPQAGHSQFSGTQTSPHVQGGGPQTPFTKAYYAPQQQPHPQQRHHTTPPPSQQQPQPQTPGGSYVRTIPIFVEGRSEPIINAHKEIPNQNSAPQTTAKVYVPQQQQQKQPQQHRPIPINTQKQQTQGGGQQPAGMPPQTPHTLDSISKIQDIQRDVLDLMGHVEKFAGTRQDKEYAYLDEMLTRNLLKLDTIDTNGKDSIRLARKEAIKCIQASINVLEAKANENSKAAQQNSSGADGKTTTEQAIPVAAEESKPTEQKVARKSTSKEKVAATKNNDATEAAKKTAESEAEPTDVKQIQAPIPLPPPEGMQADNEASAAAGGERAKSVEASGSAGELKKQNGGGETASATNAATVRSDSSSSAKNGAESNK